MNPLESSHDILVQFSTAPPWALLLTKATLLLAVAWLLHFSLSRANPRWPALLWRGTVVGLALLAVWTLGLPGLEIRIQVPEPVATAPAAYIQPILMEQREPIPAVATARPMQDSAFVEMAGVPGQTSGDVRPDAPRPVESSKPSLSWRIVLLGIWGIGVALLIARLAIAYVRLARLLQTTQTAPDEIIVEVGRIAAALRCRRAVQVRTSRQYAVPFLYGLRRPVLVLPAQMCQPAYRGQLPGVIAHELGHVGSGDFGWNAGVQAVSILLWFHPLAWRIGSAHRAACDAVCDAISASYLGDVQAYCRTLARVALDGAASFPAAGLAMARTCDVRRRIAALQQRVFAAALGRRAVVGVALVGLSSITLLAGVRLALAAEDSALRAVAQWARQHGWKAAEIKETTLESYWGGWRNLPFEVSPDEEQNARECVALARSYGSSTNGVNHFDRQETRQALEAVLARQPNYFYAEYLLAVWSQSHGDAEAARGLFERAYRHAPIVIVQRFETPGGRPVANVPMQSFALECNRVKKGWLDPSLKLLYLRLRTDQNGCIYLPVYRTVYRTDDMASPDGYEPKWPRLGWFQTSAQVGLLPVCVLKEKGSNGESVKPNHVPDADEGRQAYSQRLQRAETATPGHVADTEGRGIANATVKRANSSWTATTDAKGRFPLPELKVGETANLNVAATGFLPTRYEVEVTYTGFDYVISDGWPIQLARPTKIVGRVLGPDGKPLADAPLSLDTWVHLPQNRASTGNYAQAVTDAEGWFTLDQIPPGSHVLYYPGQAPPSITPKGAYAIPPKGVYGALVVEPTDGQQLSGLVLDLSKSTASIEGRVFGPDGKPMAGASVSGSWFHQWKGMSGGTGPYLSSTSTDADGRYKITGIGPGVWRLCPSHPRFQRGQPSQTVALALGQTATQDLRVTERDDTENSTIRAAAEAERTDDLSKVNSCFCSSGLLPVDQELATFDRLEFMDLSLGGASHLSINVKPLGLPRTATPEEVARAAHAGELYFVPPDQLVTVNGTIIAPFTPPPNRRSGPYWGQMTRAEIVQQVETSRRHNPDAEGRRIAIQKDENYIVVRSDGRGYQMQVDGVGKGGATLTFLYLGHLRLEPTSKAGGSVANVENEVPATAHAKDGMISLAEAVRAINQQAAKLPESRAQKPLTEDQVVKSIDQLARDDRLSDAEYRELKRIAETRRLPKSVVLRQFVRYYDDTDVQHGWWVRLMLLRDDGAPFSMSIRQEPVFRRPYTQAERLFQDEVRRSGGIPTMGRLVAYFGEDPKFGTGQQFSAHEADRLADAVKKAIEAKNADDLLKTYHWAGVDEATRAQVRAEAELLVKRKPSSISVSPRRFGGTLVLGLAFQTWGPNLPVLGYVVLEFSDAAGPKSVWLEFGESQGAARLVNYIVTKDEGPSRIGKPFSRPFRVHYFQTVPPEKKWIELGTQIDDAPDELPALRNANFELWKVQPTTVSARSL
jgi:beta-lactamase regulating signal transducer with metallopeptidase domain